MGRRFPSLTWPSPQTTDEATVDSRRDAIKKLAGLVALTAVAAPSCAQPRADAASDSTARDSTSDADVGEGGDEAALVSVAGLGLYTVRSEMEKSVEATLERVARIGYKEVEFAGYFGKSPGEIAAILKSNGLTSPSVHVPLADIRGKLNEVMEAATTIGHRYLVCPWVGEEERGAADDWRRIAAELNKAAEAASRGGFLMAYHNHDFEFAPIAGTNAYSILLAELDPRLVQIELDLYWATKAGQDPVALFKANPGRFPMVHVKDMARDGSFAEVGAGTIDFRRIFAQARLAGIRHYYVEHDQPKDVFQSITQSYRGLRRIPAR